jgi:hypothetical protein
MAGYQQVLRLAAVESDEFGCLDVAQLAKHALAIRTQMHRPEDSSRKGVLYYIYADPESWPDGRKVAANLRRQHKTELERFSAIVAHCEVRFIAAPYGDLLRSWQQSGDENLQAHAVVMSAWLNKHRRGVGHGIAKGRRV